MKRYEISEYGQLCDVVLTPEQRDALLLCDAKLTVSPQPGTSSRWLIRSSSIVGVVNTPGLVLVIKPKLSIARLFLMISASIAPIRWDKPIVSFDQSATLEDIIGVSLVTAIRSLTSQGLLRGYILREEESVSVRGKISIAETVRRHPATLLPFVQTPELHEEDIAENQIMLTALRVLQPRVHSIDVRRRLLDCQRFFAEITPLLPNHALPKIARTRLNARWWEAIQLALLVIRSCGLELPVGTRQANAFLVNMNEVFELFVYYALNTALQRHDVRLDQGQRGLYLDTDRHHDLRPDLSVWKGQRCLFAGDAKYKSAMNGYSAREDIYQALAYATATRLPSIMLIYGAGSVLRRDTLLTNEIIVKVRSLNLSASDESLRQQVDGLAQEIARQVI